MIPQQSFKKYECPEGVKGKRGRKMTRVPMVTRTITTTKVNCLCLDVESGEPFNKEFSLPRTYKDNQALITKIREMYDTDNEKVVHIVDKEETKALYGMREDIFILNSELMKPRKVKGPKSEN